MNSTFGSSTAGGGANGTSPPSPALRQAAPQTHPPAAPLAYNSFQQTTPAPLNRNLSSPSGGSPNELRRRSPTGADQSNVNAQAFFVRRGGGGGGSDGGGANAHQASPSSQMSAMTLLQNIEQFQQHQMSATQTRQHRGVYSVWSIVSRCCQHACVLENLSAKSYVDSGKNQSTLHASVFASTADIDGV